MNTGNFNHLIPKAVVFLFIVLIVPSVSFAQCVQTILADFPSVTTKSVQVEIIDNNNTPIGWQYEIGLFDFVPDQVANGESDIQNFEIDGLQAGTQYDIYLRTICSVGDTSLWNGPFNFFTIIDNDDSCNISLPIEDNNCGTNNLFPIEITGFGSSELGQVVFIQSVSLIIEHTFPEDLEISLISPNGVQVILSANYGLGMQNYGNPADLSCTEAAVFSDLAC